MMSCDGGVRSSFLGICLHLGPCSRSKSTRRLVSVCVSSRVRTSSGLESGPSDIASAKDLGERTWLLWQVRSSIMHGSKEDEGRSTRSRQFAKCESHCVAQCVLRTEVLITSSTTSPEIAKTSVSI